MIGQWNLGSLFGLSTLLGDSKVNHLAAAAQGFARYSAADLCCSDLVLGFPVESLKKNPRYGPPCMCAFLGN